MSDADKMFIIDFVEWFGVLYGFLWSTILVKVWEQYEETNNTFDQEADAIQLLAQDLLIFGSRYTDIRLEVLSLLQKYAHNVFEYMTGKKTFDEEVQEGKSFLSDIRKKYGEIFKKNQ